MVSLAEKHEDVVTKMRTYLYGLCRRRNDRVVTADDAQNWLDRQSLLTGRNRIRDRIAVINSTFQGGLFENVGMTNSVRPEARSRTITEWSYSN